MFVCVFNIFTGVDVNNCYFSDPDAPTPDIIPNAAHRKIIQYWDFVDDSDYQNGHGTVSALVCLVLIHSIPSMDKRKHHFYAFGNIIHFLLTTCTTHENFLSISPLNPFASHPTYIFNSTFLALCWARSLMVLELLMVWPLKPNWPFATLEQSGAS